MDQHATIRALTIDYTQVNTWMSEKDKLLTSETLLGCQASSTRFSPCLACSRQYNRQGFRQIAGTQRTCVMHSTTAWLLTWIMSPLKLNKYLGKLAHAHCIAPVHHRLNWRDTTWHHQMQCTERPLKHDYQDLRVGAPQTHAQEHSLVFYMQTFTVYNLLCHSSLHTP